MRKEKSSIGLQKDWKLAKLGECVDVLDNLRKPINSEERQKRIRGKKEKDLFPYYGATGQVGLIDDYLTDGEYILVGEDGAPFLDLYKNKAYKIKGKSWVNNHAHILKGKEGVSINEYVLYYLNSIDYREHVNGTTRLKLTKGSLINIPFALPPIATQQAIVSKIDELFSELDKGIESLRMAQQQLKVYRQSVLKWAFEGKLTNEDLKEGELPQGWKVGILGNEAKCTLGKMLDKNKNTGIYFPYLRNINVRWNKFNVEDLLEMKFNENDAQKYDIIEGDLIICEGGEPGRAAIWRGQLQKMKIQKALHRVRFNDSVNPEYFLYFLNLISKNKQIEKYFTGTTIKHLTQESLRKIHFPLPQLSEQEAIVEKIESRLRLADKMEESIAQSLQQADVMRQSILKRAVEGYLPDN